MNSTKGKYDSPFKATLSGILDLFKKKDSIGSLRESDRLEGKRILITGASSGLGLAAAKQLAALGGEVIMAVRSGIPDKGEEVKKASGNSKIHMIHVDLIDFTSIEHLITAVKSGFGSIDILICNAAVVVNRARKTRAGLDEMFTVNYLAKFVLINGLIKHKCFNRNTSEVPRIVIVSSESHRNPESFEWDTFGHFRDYGMSQAVERYGYYKLLLTTFAVELSRRLNSNPDDTFSVFSLCPGPVNSNIAREAPRWVQPPMKLVFKIFFRSPEKAAEPVIYLSASKELPNKTFDYLFLMGRKKVDHKALDPENGKRLWEETERLLTRL